MAALLQAAAKRHVAPGYVRRLLSASGTTDGPLPAKQALVEPLSERELTVLRLLVTELTGPQIAAELFISLNTLRSHTKHIFEKLAVSGRPAAVRRAHELRLI